MTDYTESTSCKCPHCKTTFTSVDGPNCDCDDHIFRCESCGIKMLDTYLKWHENLKCWVCPECE